MRQLTVRDVMSSPVVTVSVTTPFKDVARLLEQHRISAVPVLGDQDELVGIVSEADLLLHRAHRGSRRRADWLTGAHLREVLATIDGDVAGDLMTAPAVTVPDSARLVEAARLMSDKRVKRLPVLDSANELVGVVSRADLVSVFVRPDDEIRDDIRHEIFRRVLLTAPGDVDVQVHDGVVTLRGRLDRHSSVEIAERLTARVDGVVDVANELAFDQDDVESRTARMLHSLP